MISSIITRVNLDERKLNEELTLKNEILKEDNLKKYKLYKKLNRTNSVLCISKYVQNEFCT